MWQVKPVNALKYVDHETVKVFYHRALTIHFPPNHFTVEGEVQSPDKDCLTRALSIAMGNAHTYVLGLNEH